MTLELATVHPEPKPLGLVSAEDATSTWDCKIGGCPRSSHLNRGPYAYLCDVHRQEKVDRDREERERERAETGRVGVPERPRAPKSDLDGSEAEPRLLDAVEALKRPAKRLEQALGRRKTARAEATAAVAEFNSALRNLREIAEKLLA